MTAVNMDRLRELTKRYMDEGVNSYDACAEAVRELEREELASKRAAIEAERLKERLQ